MVKNTKKENMIIKVYEISTAHDYLMASLKRIRIGQEKNAKILIEIENNLNELLARTKKQN